MTRHKKNYARILAIALAVLWVSVAGDAPAAAAPAITKCAPKKVAVRRSAFNDTNSTSFSFFSNVPETKVRFTMSTESCVLVRFAAEAAADTSRVLKVRVLLDGTTAFDPAEAILIASSGPYYNARSLDFVIENVPAGRHTVVVQFRSTTDELVYLRNRTTTVQYR